MQRVKCRVSPMSESNALVVTKTEDASVPHNIEAEQALLGAILLNNRAIENVIEFLKPEHFHYPAHGQIYQAIQALLEKNQVADPITLKDFFNQSEILKNIGGAGYLVDLTTSVISVMNTGDYGRIIYDLYLRRQLMSIAQETTDECRTSEIDTSAVDIVEGVERKLYSLVTQGATSNTVAFRDALTQAIESAEEAFKRDSHIVGVTSGLLDLDRWLGGMHPSDLLILAGRPSMGKTALATNIAFNAARAYNVNQREGAVVAFFSLEMSAEQLAMRILASESGISSDKIRRGAIRREDFPKFVEVSRNIHDVKMFIDDTPGLSVSALRNKARRLKRQHNVGMIVIDYLQLIDAASKKSSDGRVQEVSSITRSLKTLAKELNVPVLALSQLSRAVEQRDDKRPQLADLRESGSIEQDADVVMFIYREEYYESRKEPKDGTEEHTAWQQRMGSIYNQADVIIAKQRHGPVGTVKLFFDAQLTKFGNAA